MQLETLEDLGGRPRNRLPALLCALGFALAVGAVAWTLLRGGAKGEAESGAGAGTEAPESSAAVSVAPAGPEAAETAPDPITEGEIGSAAEGEQQSDE